MLGLGEDAKRIGDRAFLFEEFLAREDAAGRLKLPLRALPETRALLHGHCHQKAFDAVDATRRVLALVPNLAVDVVESSCCGMAGSFGYDASHYDVSLRMAELSLLPAVRAAAQDTLIVADGTSCRHQIADGTRGGCAEACRACGSRARTRARSAGVALTRKTRTHSRDANGHLGEGRRYRASAGRSPFGQSFVFGTNFGRGCAVKYAAMSYAS